MQVTSAAQVKRIEEALCQAAVSGASPVRLTEIRESLLREFTALKAATAKPEAAAR